MRMTVLGVGAAAIGELGWANAPAVAQLGFVELEAFPVTHGPYVIGRHTARLDFAAGECGGQYDGLKVDPLLKGLAQKRDIEAGGRYRDQPRVQWTKGCGSLTRNG
jgi:hypothetical protein